VPTACVILDGPRSRVELRVADRLQHVGDWTHPSLNVWVSKARPFVRNTLKKQFGDEVQRRVRLAGLGPLFGPVSIAVVYYFRGARRRDLDNYTPKFLLDGLRSSGLIADDAKDIVRELSVRLERDDTNPRTLIYVTTLEAQPRRGEYPRTEHTLGIFTDTPAAITRAVDITAALRVNAGTGTVRHVAPNSRGLRSRNGRGTWK
jgi:Holliday junction resolvase RusA-like endonuclease